MRQGSCHEMLQDQQISTGQGSLFKKPLLRDDDKYLAEADVHYHQDYSCEIIATYCSAFTIRHQLVANTVP